MIIPTIFVLNGIQRDTQKYLRDILSWTWYAHNTKHSSMHKNEEQTRKICRTSIITKPTKPYSTTIFPYLNIYTKSKKTRVKNLKYIENKRKTHTISWRLMKKIEVLWVTMEALGEGEADKTRCVNMMRGKTEKFLKTV